MNPANPLPDAVLERYLLGELPPDRLAEVERRISNDSSLQNRLAALGASDRAILEAYPTLAGLNAARAASAPAPRRTPAAPSLGERASGLLASFARPRYATAFASLAVIGVVAGLGLRRAPAPAVPGNSQGTETAVEPHIRYKGLEAGLAIYRKTAAGTELLPPLSPARPGDTLQICYRSFRDLHGIIFSVDGGGALTLHLPEEGGDAVRLEQGDLRPLPHAYLLDKAPRHERFYLVTSPSVFPVDSVLAAARRELAPDRPLPDSLRGLPAGFRQYAYTLRKETAARKPKKGAAP